MKTKRAYWFEVSLRFERMMDDSTEKKVNEIYVLDGTSFSEAEHRALKEVKSFVRGGIEIKNINPAPYKEVFFSEDEEDDKWFKAKISFITIDESTNKEKRTNVTYLVQASDIDKALKNVESVMEIGMSEYITANIAETKIMDVFE